MLLILLFVLFFCLKEFQNPLNRYNAAFLPSPGTYFTAAYHTLDKERIDQSEPSSHPPAKINLLLSYERHQQRNHHRNKYKLGGQ